MRKLGIAVAAIGLLLALWISFHRRNPAHTKNAGVSSAPYAAAPALTFVDLGGQKIETASFQGKVVLINFWAAWCTPCAEEIPQLVALQEKYRAAGFQAVGISMEDKESALRDFYRKYKMNYPVVIGNQRIAQEFGGILGLPTTFLIGRDGRIRTKYSGLVDFPKLEQEIMTLLRTGS
jgi:cytochrome c biogenesis protein CcmG/thiol:disulfide interchange protein DsbE